MSTPMISPKVFRTAFPLAPEPLPPQKTTFGGPQDCGPRLQLLSESSTTLPRSREKS